MHTYVRDAAVYTGVSNPHIRDVISTQHTALYRFASAAKLWLMPDVMKHNNRFLPAAIARIPRAELQAVILSIVVGVVLLSLKFTAYYLTDSSAIFSDAVESIVNVLASCVALWALALAHTPPDENHPYGHGKIEFVSAGFEGGMILLAAVFVFVQTVDSVIFQDTKPQRVDTGLWLVTIATLVNAAVGALLVRVGKKQASLTLEADGYHLLADAITSVGVMVALLVVYFTGFTWADPIAAVLIAIYIARTGLKLVRKSFGGLMDQQDADDEKRLVAILDSHTGQHAIEPKICSYHKLRHRHSGRYHWVDFHLVVPAHLSIKQGHEIASKIEYEMELMLRYGNATAHVEPCGECETHQ
jgi:cation diffusion facilitator family transporter